MSAPIEFSGTDRFQVLRCLGEGSMGVVYEALDRERGCRVALKTVRTRGGDDLLRLKNEFRALQDLEHPNLVSLGELLEHEGCWFFTMELVDGQGFIEHVRPFALRRAAANAPPGELPAPGFDEGRLRGALGQLCLGLDALHREGKVHRDIKPTNVLVTAAGRVVLLDLGLVADIDPARPTSSSNILGTVDYMAPEQAGAGPVGPPADWYAVGVVLYEALTGRVPVVGAPYEVLVLKGRVDPTPPERLVRGVPPDLAELCLALLRPDPGLRPSGAEVLGRLGLEEGAARPAGAPSQSGARAVFVGRQAEQELLAAGFDAAQAGRAVAILVSGESGVGKTALVRHFTAGLVASGKRPVVLTGRCYERETVPFKAVDGVVDALSRHLTHLPLEVAAGLLPRAAGLLGEVFPVLRRVKPIAEAPRRPADARIDPQELRTRLFGAMRELLARLADRRPLVLVIDDLQWADADSLALLGEVLRPPEAPALLLVGTLRADAGAEGEAPGLMLGGEVRRVRLERLAPGDARELAARLCADAAPAASAAAIAAEAGGHPLFIHELVRHAAAQGGAASGPLRLDEVVQGRARALPGPARRVLDLVAVAGTPIAQETVARAAGMEPEAFDRTVALLRVGMLVQTTGARRDDAVQIYHDRVREALLCRLTPDARAALHRELALALEAGRRADPEDLAVHWHGAGEDDRAAGHAARAAAEAEAALAFDHAARLYRFALELRPPEHAGARELTVRLGDALANAGRGAESAETYAAAARGAPPAIALELRRRAAEQLMRSGNIDAGLAALREVLAAVGMRLPKTPRRALLSALVGRALVRLRGLGFRERHASQLSSEELTRLDICWSVSSSLGVVDNISGVDFNARTLLLSLRAGEPMRLVRALSVETVMAALAGRAGRPRTESLLRVVAGLEERLDQPEVHAWVAAARGFADYYVGRFDRCREHLERTETILRGQCAGMPWEIGTARLFLLFALVYLGRIGETARRLPGLVAEALDRGDRYAATNLRLSLLNAMWLVEDNVAEARRVAREASAGWSRRGFHVQHWFDLMAQAQLALYEGDGRAAHARVAEVWSALERSLLLRIQLVRCEAWHLRARCALAAAAADPGAAGPLRAAAARDARRILGERVAWAAPFAHLVLAAVAGGREPGRRAALEHAVHGFAAGGLELYAAAARRRLGEAIGGDEGRTLVAAADAWLAAERLRAPDRWVAMLAPGLGE